MRSVLKSLALVALAVTAPVFAGPPYAFAQHQVTDAAGRQVEVRDTSRVVSIGGAVTEILFALGLGDRVVGVDQTSTYPAEARSRPNVGYSRTLAPEGVLSADPSLILAIEGAGPPATLDVLKQASVPVVLVPDGHTPESVVRKIEIIADAMGVPEKGRALADAVRADFTALAEGVAQLKGKPRAVFVLSASSGAPVVGGAGTSADAMFHLAGVTNAMAGIPGFKPAVDEVALTADPDAVVVMTDGGQKLTADVIFSLPAFKGTPAAHDGRLVALPGSYLLGFGPRAPQAARDLALALHPGESLPELPPRPWAGGGK
ncbi:heme/hemin ABC transporter substrate-binding protein [Aquabacter sp. P-9]|uniref:heme/hemin ABC transporter substrate-binding protein n=1 Tax=Aquabacter sediminis TaxID=3029197 RepID=UPI00237EB52D|nr:ABC transporter substrate-binding protein [Aquabacter sp. P-9]MDE1569212.1 ABC transporter substrate-binding protein [Aquabacter sp. P-9]